MPFPTLISVNEWKKFPLDKTTSQGVENLLKQVYSATTIYSQFDALTSLQEFCDKQKNPACHQLSQSITEIFKCILDEKNEALLKDKVQARKDLREVDPYYIPWERPGLTSEIDNNLYSLYKKMKASHLDPEGMKDELKQFYKTIEESGDLLEEVEVWQDMSDSKDNIARFDDAELERFRIIPWQKKLIKIDINGKEDDRKLSFSFFDSAKLSIKSMSGPEEKTETNVGIYTVHVNGSMFVGPSIHSQRISWLDSVMGVRPTFHPSYAKPVYYRFVEKANLGIKIMPFMAGQLGHAVKGVLGEIDAASGHFRPTEAQTTRAVNFFQATGIVNNNTNLPVFQPLTKAFTTWNLPMIYRDSIYQYSIIKKQELMPDLMINFLQNPQEFLKENLKENPELHHRFAQQISINDEYNNWMKDSYVVGSVRSKEVLKLDDAIQLYSNYAHIDKIDESQFHIQNVLNAINDWKESHKIKSSKREPAVKALEEKMLDKMIDFKLYKACQLLDHKTSLVRDYLAFKIDRNTFLNGIKKEMKENSSTFFSSSKPAEFYAKIAQLDFKNPRNVISELGRLLETAQDLKTEKIILKAK